MAKRKRKVAATLHCINLQEERVEKTMLLGWKALSRATGFTAKTLRFLMKTGEFPVFYIGRRPVSTPEQISDWLNRCFVEGRRFELPKRKRTA